MKLGKYEIKENRLFNTEKQEFVPEDVLGFVMLSTDKKAPAAIYNYASQCENEAHAAEVFEIVTAFGDWRKENPDRVHEPNGIGI